VHGGIAMELLFLAQKGERDTGRETRQEQAGRAAGEELETLAVSLLL